MNPEHVIVDFGYSGGNTDRPGFKKLHELAVERQIDIIVTTKLDRCFRSLSAAVNYLKLWNDELGVKFCAVKDQVDLSTASGRLMVHLISAMAEFERSLAKERVVMALDHARSRGVKLGRPEASQDLLEQIRELKNKGYTHRKIQAVLKCGASTIQKALKQA